MLLSRKQIIEGIIFPLLFLYACGETKKPDSYVARVNDSYLTEGDLSEIIDSQNVSGRSRTSVINNWIRQEILYQEAVKEGLTKTKDYSLTIERAKHQLAAALLLEKFTHSSKHLYETEELQAYYEKTKTSFRLPYNSFFMNLINFSDMNTAVQFRSQVIAAGWEAAVDTFSYDTSLFKVSGNILISEQDIYPSKLLRVLQDLYPLEISIVIPDDRGYYTVVQLIEKYVADTIPPFEAVKTEVEKRYLSVLNELAVEEYIINLYSQNEIEIND